MTTLELVKAIFLTIVGLGTLSILADRIKEKRDKKSEATKQDLRDIKERCNQITTEHQARQLWNELHSLDVYGKHDIEIAKISSFLKGFVKGLKSYRQRLK